MEPLSSKALVASAILGAVVASPTAFIFSGGSVVGACLAAVVGAGSLVFVRRKAGARLWLVALATLLTVVICGPILVTIGGAVSSGTGHAGFIGVLFMMATAGQLVALPLGLVTALIHVLVARFTR